MPPKRSRPAPVQKFRPTSGTALGHVGIAATLLAIGLVAVTEPSLVGLRICVGLAAFGLLLWLALLRPRVTAYDETLVLRGLASDLHLPLAGIDTAVVRHTLNVWLGEDRYVSPAIGRSSRKMLNRRSRGPMAVLGVEQTDDRMGLGQAGEIGSSGDYATFVENRIEDLARSARRDLRGEPPPVRREWAVPELTALAVLTVAFLLTYLLG